MSDALKRLWEYKTGRDVCAVALTPEAHFVAAGAEDGCVYALSRDGQLLWKYETEGWARSVAITADGKCVLAGSSDHFVYALSSVGELLWKYDAEGRVLSLAVSPDGEYLVAGGGHALHALSPTGQLLWKYNVDAGVPGTAVSADAEYVVAGTGDNFVHFMSRTGQLLWRYEAGDDVNAVAVSADADRVVAGSDDDFVHVLSRDGQLLWKHQTGDDVYAVAISADGEYIMAGADDRHLYLHGRGGRLLERRQLGHLVRGMAATPTGRHIAVGTWGRRVFLFENLAAPEWLTGQRSTSPDSKRVIGRIREAYIANAHGGRALWFEEFDRLLAHSHFDACEELLEEAREEGYGFGTGEYRYLDSREGALWLRRGVALQREGEFAEAEEHYLRGMEAQKRARYTIAQGEVQMALHALAEEMATEQSDPFLDTIDRELTVLGDSETLLCGRLDAAGEEECDSILCAAVELRLVRPLMEALERPAGRVTMMAAAALARFRHDGDQDRLLAGIQHQQWFTRWRSSEAVGWAEGLPPELIPVIGSALENEPDPEARHALALSLGRQKDRRATPSLVMALADGDADVRWAAAEALSQAGDRQALAGLRQAADGNDFLGRSVREAARTAIGEIE
ncbi:MAG: PQQ-binding-like beta-propeller repeat protein, partial [Victivallales bacterium]|nr:PQQ-binding-like beta-propeller repeat protein [Victivallales bacterium]